MDDTITFDLTKDEAQDLLNRLQDSERENEECETIKCMIETLADFLY